MAETVEGVPVDARDRHAGLAQELDEHRYRYYVLDRPTVSDGQYDAMFRARGALSEPAYPGFADAEGR